MAKLENIRIYLCPLTDKIYAGYLNKGETFNANRVAVTDQALSAVMAYLGKDKTPREISCGAGKLRWIPHEN